ncbi:MAG: hypothetical protein P8X55_04185 [Desulfosarcinaceae bacterium]
MDDFLHNLRSGKLKQPDRGNRNYNDAQYKNAQRRNMMDRRNKRDVDSKESFERMNAIKEVLESLAETQKRMAEAYEARTRAEERKARAMEVLAKNLYKMINPGADNIDELFAFSEPALLSSQTLHPDLVEDESGRDESALLAMDRTRDRRSEKADNEATEPAENRKLSESDRNDIAQMTSELREEGQSWEKIARQIAAQGYPTISGKGTWRGVMVKNLFEKMEAEQFNR